MGLRVSIVVVVLLCGCTTTGQPAISCGEGTVLQGNECVSAAQTLSDKEIRKILIKESIRSYPGRVLAHTPGIEADSNVAARVLTVNQEGMSLSAMTVTCPKR